MDEPIRHTLSVTSDPANAFALFTEELGRWWPHEYTWGQQALEAIGIEPFPDGMCYERGPHGFRCDWGRVLVWEPPHRLVLAWQISPRREPVPDPARASEVEINFEPADTGEPGMEGGTRVTLEHREFARHGDGAAEYRDALGSPEGWPYIMSKFAEAAA